jgi:hypothetical protein
MDMTNDEFQQQMFSFMMFCMFLVLMLQIYHLCDIMDHKRTLLSAPPPTPTTSATPPSPPPICKNKGTQVDMYVDYDAMALRNRTIVRRDASV